MNYRLLWTARFLAVLAMIAACKADKDEMPLYGELASRWMATAIALFLMFKHRQVGEA